MSNAFPESLLITAVQKKELLWRRSHPMYKYAKKRSAEWKAIADSLNCDAKTVSRKWRCLVTTFTKELALGVSGDNPNENFKSSWVHFQSLLFLRPEVEAAPSTGNLDVLLNTMVDCNNENVEAVTSQNINAIEKPIEVGMNCSNIQNVEKKLSGYTEFYDVENVLSNLTDIDFEVPDYLTDISDTKCGELTTNIKEKEHMNFFSTLLSTVKKIKSKDLLNYREEISKATYKYAYRDKEWNNISSSTCTSREVVKRRSNYSNEQ